MKGDQLLIALHLFGQRDPFFKMDEGTVEQPFFKISFADPPVGIDHPRHVLVFLKDLKGFSVEDDAAVQLPLIPKDIGNGDLRVSSVLFLPRLSMVGKAFP